MSCGVKWSDLTAEFYGVSTVLIMGRSGISMDFIGSKHHLEFFSLRFAGLCWVYHEYQTVNQHGACQKKRVEFVRFHEHLAVCSGSMLISGRVMG